MLPITSMTTLSKTDTCFVYLTFSFFVLFLSLTLSAFFLKAVEGTDDIVI